MPSMERALPMNVNVNDSGYVVCARIILLGLSSFYQLHRYFPHSQGPQDSQLNLWDGNKKPAHNARCEVLLILSVSS